MINKILPISINEISSGWIEVERDDHLSLEFRLVWFLFYRYCSSFPSFVRQVIYDKYVYNKSEYELN